jgi:hypothetical protein
MVGQNLLLIAVLVLAGLPVVHKDATCTAAEWSAGLCSTGTITGDHVDVGTESGSGSSGSSDESAADAPAAPPNEACVTQARACAGGVAIAVSVTVSDLASFYPQKPTVTGEPNGWAIIGLDTNFISSAAVHTASGSLAGRAANVRFTPQRFLWDYGDGIRATTTTGGSRWKQLGVAEFTPTATSHVYSAAGTYRVRLAVEYTAQYRIGAGAWQGVPGTLRLSAPTTTVVATDAKTVLVQRDCAVDPRGPGC